MRSVWRHLEEVICGCVFLCMTLLGFINVAVRNLTNYSLASTQELIINGMVLLTVFGAAIAAKKGQHLAVTVFYDLVPASFKRALVVLSTLLIIATLALCTLFTVTLLSHQFTSGVVSSALQIPQWYYTLIVPLGFLMLMIRQLELAIAEFRRPGDASC
ncbi:TRAP transporter small permease [Salinicola corii]|mgnify:CR=1 FL=1|uniref:TRAP transporter small permease protein n=1 Tax=Salinicola corii TaxID=2606937 RepID=A0A640WGR3_9GAMM|nr:MULTISPECIES: TRAP transporter small permease [Salinicola]KAA0019576.1 TRAP transporter small permease [Salinicola corii]MAM59822.1 C4-dicarboxylate ABC transporter permease [Salinicola sp.]NRB57688.1 TRAP transporter small permease subunit [Salinicola sp.]|tara:strand:+ start:254 stop:730 length:477 start_codon:yes stop_codon:yes gene_type:complete